MTCPKPLLRHWTQAFSPKTSYRPFRKAIIPMLFKLWRGEIPAPYFDP